MPQNNKPGRRLLRRLYGSWYRVRRNISAFSAVVPVCSHYRRGGGRSRRGV